MTPRVSVVIPSYNDAVMLEQCLTALDGQTRLADEVVVVDNGSSDATVDVALAHGARVVTEPKRGIPQATSAGLDAAKGDVIGRLDADSIPPKDWIARIAVAFEDPELDVLSGPGEYYGATRLQRWYGERLQMPIYYGPIAWVFGHQVVFGSNFAIRADAWRAIRGRVHRDDREVHDDFDIAMNLLPGMGVRFDRSLVVGVSARPLTSWSRMMRTYRMGIYTFVVNHREQSLLARRRAWTRRSARGGEPRTATETTR
ncbi:MAG TPA: glycosyltransferase family 2 protein [Microbacteriaceae bacterium]|nr:glycosyltransferase family 2 protein [Microbacteriaceae bacterium]